jgi:hypothetical protein
VIVTEAKLTEITGYTNGQIRHRRSQAWDKGVHYWTDPANTTVYDLEAITAWQTKERPRRKQARQVSDPMVRRKKAMLRDAHPPVYAS